MRGFRMARIPDEENRPMAPIRQTLGRLWPYTWSQRRWIAGGIVAILCLSGLNLVMPQLTRWTIDTIIPGKLFSLLLVVAGCIFAVNILKGCFGFVQTYFMSHAGQSVIFELRSRLYEHMQGQSLGFFHNRRTGDLMSRVTNDVNSLQQLITSGVAEVLTDVITFFFVLVLLAWIDWRLTLLLVPTWPLMIIITRRFGRRIRVAYRDVQESIANVNGHLQETIANIQVVKTFATEEHEIGRFTEHNRASMRSNLHAVRIWSLFHPIIDVVNNVGGIVVLAYGAYEVMKGRITLGTLVAFLAYLNMLNRPINRFSRILNVIQQASASAERIFEILDTEPEVQEKPDAQQPKAGLGAIRFEDVRFSYDGKRTALSDFSLEAEPGRTIALVGPSGAGKSTVVNLIMRFYDPQQGRVSIDGVDVRDLKIRPLRRLFGVVSQEAILLNGTVRENIAYASPHASDDLIEEAARNANAHDFIMQFPEGYATPIGERGVKLSGGQRQRIAIARAILKDPRILILDEATSHLDSESEYQIQQALERLMKGRTTLVIAHRLSTIQNADQVVVLDNGSIVERGTPAVLTAKQGLFAALVRRQNGVVASLLGTEDA